MEFLLFSPPLLVGCSGILLYRGLRATPPLHWQPLIGSFLLLLLSVLFVGWIASGGELLPLFAFALAGCSIIVFVIATLWIMLRVAIWRKVAAFALLITFSLLMWQGVLYGEARSPEMITQRNGDTIIQALDQYYTKHNRFPASLQELIPVYLPILPDAQTTQGTGWLYDVSGKEYTLGYWYWPEREGTMLCKYNSSTTKDWACLSASSYKDWEPFPVVPTPAPSQ